MSLKIDINTSGVIKAQKVIKRSFDNIQKESKNVDNAIKSVEKNYSNLSKSASKTNDLNKAFQILNRSISRLKRGFIDAETFQMRYGKAVSNVKKDLKDSYGEHKKSEIVLKRLNSVLEKNINTKKRNADITKNTFKEGTKALNDIRKAQEKYNKSIVTNELKRGAIALKQLTIETKKTEEAQNKLRRSIVTNAFKKGTEALNNLRKAQETYNKSVVKNYFTRNKKSLSALEKELLKTEKAQRKYNRSVVANELERGSTALKRIRKEAESLEKAQIKLNRSITTNTFKRGAKALKELRKEEEKLRKEQIKLNAAVIKSKKSFSILNIAAGNIIAAAFVRGTEAIKNQILAMKEYSDEWLKITNIIKIGTKNENELILARKKLIDISRETRTSLMAQTTLYNRLTLSQHELGASQEEILDVIKGVGFALGVTATTALESRGSLIQLAQAFGQPIVRAEEFNSILEGTPRVAQALADGFGLTRAGLRKLVLAGKVTNKELFKAFLTQLPLLEKEFSKVSVTLDQSFVLIRNAVVIMIGKFNEATGTARALAQGFSGFADILKALTPVLIKTGLGIQKIYHLIVAFPQGVIQYFKDINIELDELKHGVKTFKSLKEATEDFDRAKQRLNQTPMTFAQLTPLQKISVVLTNVGKNIVSSFTSIFKALGVGFGQVSNSILKFVNQAGISFVSLGEIMSSALTFHFDDAKISLNALKMSWKDYFKESELDWQNYELQIDKILKDAEKNRIPVTSLSGRSKADEERLAQQKIIDADKKHFRILQDKQKARERANRDIKEQSRIRLETIQKEFKSTGIISRSGIKLLINGIEEEKKAYIKNTGDKVTAEKIAWKKITDLYEKAYSNEFKLSEAISAKRESERQKEEKRLQTAFKLIEKRKTIKPEKSETVKEVKLTGLDKYIDDLNKSLNATTLLENATVSAFKNMEDALVSYITKGKFEFKDFARTAVTELTRIIVRQQLIAPLAGAFKGSNLFSSIGKTISSLFHGGGVVGQPTQQRSVDPTIFASAPKFHNGLLPGEYPAILKQGETVRTAEQERSLNKNNTPMVNINIENKKPDAEVTTTQPFIDDQGKLTIGIVVDALQRNVGGLRDVTRSVVAAR